MMEWDGLTPPDLTQLVSEFSAHPISWGGQASRSFDRNSTPMIVLTRAIPHSPSRYLLGSINPPPDRPQTARKVIRSD